MIRRIDPDEPVNINGVLVTGWKLAEARQELSHRGVHNPRWAELSEHDQETAAISASSWLQTLAELVGASDHKHVWQAGRCVVDNCPDQDVMDNEARPSGGVS